MPYVFKKKYPAILLWILISIASPIHADYEMPNYNSNSSCQPTCCETCNDGWILNADLLYWRALQNGLECGCGPNVRDRWDLGYRIGLEYYADSPGWDIAAYWTHFDNHSHRENDNGDNVHWKLRYDTADLLLGYAFSTTSCSSLTPFVGLRGAWIDEKLKGHFGNCGCYNESSNRSSARNSYFNGSSYSEGLFSDFNDHATTDQNHKERFWGVGPEIGINADWILGCGLSVYGGFGVGLLYGNFKINVHDYESIYDPTDNGHCCIHRNINACQLFCDIAVGIQWDFCLCNNMIGILKLGVEHHRYFNQNHIGGYGDLCLDGGIFSASIQY